MKKIKCPKCRNRIHKNWEKCPYCNKLMWIFKEPPVGDDRPIQEAIDSFQSKRATLRKLSC